ncbi:MAG: hypothetical protein IH872_09805 [Chloroflexi bacterium]|nr:hypothetical protein [Chloroflexota bacterium]
MTQTHQQHRSPLLNRRETYTAVTDAAYTAKAGDQVIGVNRAGIVTITLPTAEVRPGRIYTVKDESGAANANNITIATEGSENIDGSPTHVLSTDYQGVSLYSDGTNWFIVPIVAAGTSATVTREGGQTTEATTTSTSTVDLLTAASLTIPIGTPVEVHAMLRRTTGTATTAKVGLKLNTTAVRSPLDWGPSANNPDTGLLHMLLQHGLSSYSFGHYMFVTNPDQLSYFDISGGIATPVAELTDIILQAKVGSSSITMGADEMHVYSKAVS